MITNKLSVLMAERNLKATRIASDTGIARSTLTGLTSENSKMIQFETINTLCQYLGTDPSGFFEYTPIDVHFDIEVTNIEAFNRINSESLNWNTGISDYSADVFVKFTDRGNHIKTIELSAKLKDEVVQSGAEDFVLSGSTSVNIDINSKDDELQKFWNEKNLYPFYSIVGNQFSTSVYQSVINSANDAVDDDPFAKHPTFGDWKVSAVLPILPF
ncbi:helix-turn-helix domain-containing protein [Secundilactobacillus malefermentans]|uniref:helix-turn-helix domain-containing protein n=1 Tax=Secundilactobacillus malefermentans TaxID=176292 RepID=UPI0011CC0030|nr:helix-turn-helix transcriptional regulator [Secundilactobacillus malefermentans]QEA32115.1 helix-turn-helix transcriptional regulator [Secundilactobacillus malefermentans]